MYSVIRSWNWIFRANKWMPLFHQHRLHNGHFRGESEQTKKSAPQRTNEHRPMRRAGARQHTTTTTSQQQLKCQDQPPSIVTTPHHNIRAFNNTDCCWVYAAPLFVAPSSKKIKNGLMVCPLDYTSIMTQINRYIQQITVATLLHSSTAVVQQCCSAALT